VELITYANDQVGEAQIYRSRHAVLRITYGERLIIWVRAGQIYPSRHVDLRITYGERPVRSGLAKLILQNMRN